MYTELDNDQHFYLSYSVQRDYSLDPWLYFRRLICDVPTILVYGYWEA